MKTKITLLAIVLSFTMSAQDYNQLTIEPQIGFTKVQDVTSVQPINFNLGARYMLNTLFGAKVSVGHTALPEHDFSEASLVGVMNMGRVLNFESFTKKYTILAGIGGTYTHSDWPSNDNIMHRTSNFHLLFFATNEFKLSKRLFLTAGIDVMTGVNSRPFNNISTETTNIIDFNLGLNIALGKEKEHADWYIPEVVSKVDTLWLKPTIIDETKTIVNNIPQEILKENETLLFANDSDVVLKGEENIEKAVKNAENKITLIAYCSNVGTVKHNEELAYRRAKSVERIIRGLHYTGPIEIDARGIRTELGKEVHDLARSVLIIVE